jgi:hypothetical protein
MTNDKPQGHGVLFRREKRSENYPDFTGKAVDQDGKEHAVAAWLDDGRIRLALRPWENRTTSPDVTTPDIEKGGAPPSPPEWLRPVKFGA